MVLKAFRIAAEEWEAFVARARAEGEGVSERLRRLIREDSGPRKHRRWPDEPPFAPAKPVSGPKEAPERPFKPFPKADQVRGGRKKP